MRFSAGQSFGDFVLTIVDLINLAVPVLVGVALVLFLYGGVRYIMRSGSTKGRSKDRDTMFWGMVALFVVVSIWGVLRFMCVSLLDDPSCGQPQQATWQPATGNPLNILQH